MEIPPCAVRQVLTMNQFIHAIRLLVFVNTFMIQLRVDATEL